MMLLPGFTEIFVPRINQESTLYSIFNPWVKNDVKRILVKVNFRNSVSPGGGDVSVLYSIDKSRLL